jgi:GST-like protein
MAAWDWTRMIPFIMGDNASGKYPKLKRHHDAIAARPARSRRPSAALETFVQT